MKKKKLTIFIRCKSRCAFVIFKLKCIIYKRMYKLESVCTIQKIFDIKFHKYNNVTYMKYPQHL